ncbi:MAG TPA: hypothetical protein VK184_11430 [Nostocaceae cyanobacterium]|nr:hypothetical protein [Nostocaceae cyanobacterium]
MDFKTKMLVGWNGKPPRIKFKAEPMPGTPYVRLLGCGIADMSLENFIKDLERDKKTGNGHGHTFPINGKGCEEDTYVLEGWEVYTSPDSCYEALVLLYYSALYPYHVIKKYMGEDMAAEYLEQQSLARN